MVRMSDGREPGTARARPVLRTLGRLALVASMTLGGAVLVASPAQALASRTVAFYSMDEPAGATVLHDSSGNHRDGTIGADVTTGLFQQGASIHRFATHLPADGAFPGHVDRIPHSADLNPDAGDFSIEVRLRTDYPFGNILQKGQGATAGGYWKLENPNGLPRCLFRGGNGASRTGYSTVPIDDGEWHTIRCNRTSTFVEMWVDGVRQSRLTGSTGTISNTWGLSVGGKGDCDGVKVTCDYFVGDLDYVRIEKGSGGAANVAPTAAVDVSCVGLTCAFDASGSTDPDGAIQRYAWDLGDGATHDGGADPAGGHVYAAAGTYQVTLTVTDDRGATSSTTTEVTVAPVAETISFVGQATSNVNATTHQVVVPAAAQEGDLLLLLVSQNTGATLTGPTGGSWSQLDTLAGGYGRTTAWYAVAGPASAGTAVRVGFSSITKANVVLAVYRGVDVFEAPALAATSDATSSAVRVTPYAQVTTPGSWAVSYWMHGDSTTSTLLPPAGVTVRSNGSQTGGGRVAGMLADTAVSLPPGSYGGKAATAAAASTTSTTWTVVLAPDLGPPPVDLPPTATFTQTCQDLTCTFDASSSSDPEGALASYAWDFGDGTTHAGAEPGVPHTFPAAGTYQVQLTVADAAAQTSTAGHEVTVTAVVPEPSPVGFVAGANQSGTSLTHTVAVPAQVVPGDVLLLVLGIASPEALTDPAGWTPVGTVDGGSLRTRVWSRVAADGDAGSLVSVGVGASVKGSLSVLAYRGVDASGVTVLGEPGSGTTATRATPVAPVPQAGSWGVQVWAHRDSSTTSLVPPAGVVPRATGTQSGGGRVTTLVADSGAGLPAGTYGGLVATAAAASSHGATWTIVLPPAG